MAVLSVIGVVSLVLNVRAHEQVWPTLAVNVAFLLMCGHTAWRLRRDFARLARPGAAIGADDVSTGRSREAP